MSQTKVLAFDIGIKNLAFCLMENTILHTLENVNILPSVEKIICHSEACSAAASYTAGPKHLCKRHIPKSYTILHKIPKVAELKSLAKAQGEDIKKKTKDDLLRTLSTTHAFPYTQPNSQRPLPKALSNYMMPCAYLLQNTGQNFHRQPLFFSKISPHLKIRT